MKSSNLEIATLTVSEQAAKWLCELMEGGEHEQEEFLSWVKQSPRHVEEFLLASATWKQLRTPGTQAPKKVEEILAELAADQRNVVSLNAAHHAKSKVSAPLQESHRQWRVAGLAAALTLAALGTVLFVSLRPESYATAVGEQRAIRLPDGSVVHLNTRSRLKVNFSDEARDLELLEGEALFIAQRDPTRPFRVHSGAETIQAIGTQFNVYRRTEVTTVSVLEGAVKILNARAPATPLVAGEQAQIATTGKVVRRKAADLSQTVAWRERRLVFKATRLEDVVAEVNRYSTRQIKVEGEHARNTLLTATFAADNPDALAAFLRKYSDLSVQTDGAALVVRSR